MKVSSKMYKTGLPFSFYTTVIISLGVIVLLIPEDVIKSGFYGLMTFFFFYILFGRNTCKIILNSKELYINYVYPWDKDIRIPVTSIREVDYETGFYNLTSDKSRGGLYTFPKYCSDLLIINQKDESLPGIHIEINTGLPGFGNMIKKLTSLINP